MNETKRDLEKESALLEGELNDGEFHTRDFCKKKTVNIVNYYCDYICHTQIRVSRVFTHHILSFDDRTLAQSVRNVGQ